MLLERFEDKGLSHFSYAVGCEGQGEVVIVDPRRDIDIYLDFAHTRNLRIVGVLETHIHADFAAGTKTLAEATGADIHVSAYDEGQLYETAFAHTPMREGDALTLGKTRIEALHTPGHTPEHLSFLVYDLARAPKVPQVLLSGDFLFVGSLGRPDLIGDDVKRALAGKLYDSVATKLAPLPDFVEVNPAHGAGSMCGSGMSARPMTTLGFERLANPYLRKGLTREAFVDEILGHVPPFPPYYKLMKVLNSRGAEPFDTERELDAIRAQASSTSSSPTATSSSTCATSSPLAPATSRAVSASAAGAACRRGPHGSCPTRRRSCWSARATSRWRRPCVRSHAWGWTMCGGTWMGGSRSGLRPAIR